MERTKGVQEEKETEKRKEKESRKEIDSETPQQFRNITLCEWDYRHPLASMGDWIQDIAHFHPHPIPPNLPPLLSVPANTQIYGCSSL